MSLWTDLIWGQKPETGIYLPSRLLSSETKRKPDFQFWRGSTEGQESGPESKLQGPAAWQMNKSHSAWSMALKPCSCQLLLLPWPWTPPPPASGVSTASHCLFSSCLHSYNAREMCWGRKTWGRTVQLRPSPRPAAESRPQHMPPTSVSTTMLNTNHQAYMPPLECYSPPDHGTESNCTLERRNIGTIHFPDFKIGPDCVCLDPRPSS